MRIGNVTGDPSDNQHVGKGVGETCRNDVLAVLAVSLGVRDGNSPGGGRGKDVAPSGVHTSMLPRLKHLLWFLMVAGYLHYVILPRIPRKPAPGLGSSFSKLFRGESNSSLHH